jgi:hypothetical protein
MLCFSCKKQIPDNSDSCPFCGAAIAHKEQVKKEISFRRWQRWFFYGLLILVFAGMVGVVVKVYNINTKILSEMSMAQKTISDKSAELSKTQSDLQTTKAEAEKAKVSLDDLQKELSGKNEALSAKVAELEKTVDEKIKIMSDYERLSMALKNISASAAGISNEDLSKIPVADSWPSGFDTDGDGLSDDAEQAVGTLATSTDTDSDGFSDKIEIIGGFNPLGEGRLALDQAFANKQRGKILKQAWAGGWLWYVGLDGKRYFFGKLE